MQQLTHERSLLTRVLGAVVGLALLTGAFFVGLAVFLVMLGGAAVFMLVLYLRLRMRRGRHSTRAPGREGSEIIEGEFRVEPRQRSRQQN